MIIAVISFIAVIEVALGAGVLATGKSSIHEVLGTNLIGFGVLTIGLAGIQGEIRRAAREAARERQAAREEQQARAAADLKLRSRAISKRDRQDAERELQPPRWANGGRQDVPQAQSM